MDAGSQAELSSEDTTPKPATDEELQAILANVAYPDAERMDEELQRATTESEPTVEPQPVVEPETMATKPASAVAPRTQTESVPDPLPTFEQEVLQSINEFEMLDSAPAPETDSAPESPVGPQTVSADEEPPNYVSTGKSEKILKELLNKGSTREDASISSFLDGLVGEINEK